MQKGLINFQNLVQLIAHDKYGYYLLTNLSGTETYAGSHIASDEDQNISSGEIIDLLSQRLMLIGDGQYKILLKKSAKTPNGSAVCYKFIYGDASAEIIKPAGQMNGMGMLEVDARIEKAVSEALAKQKETHDRDVQISDLKRLIEDVRKERNKKDDAPAYMAELAGLGKIITAALVAKHVPNAVPMINGMINGITEEEEQVNTVQRTD